MASAVLKVFKCILMKFIMNSDIIFELQKIPQCLRNCVIELLNVCFRSEVLLLILLTWNVSKD